MPLTTVPGTDTQVYAPTGEDTLLTVGQVCAWLQIARSTLHKLSTEGELPTPLKVGRTVRYRASDIRAHLDQKAGAGAR